MIMKENSFGIIAEYNPFHTGHSYLVKKIKELIIETSALNKADVSAKEEPVCISVMSGNFVQRGNFAYWNKWDRARVAVEMGVDLVVELPQIYSSSGAGYFAKGGVAILDALNSKYMAFGSETGEIEKLKEIAACIDECEKNYSREIGEELSAGISFPLARMKVLLNHYPAISQEVLKGSNNILGLEYLKANGRYKKMIPLTIKRAFDSHQESASKIREELLKNPIEKDRLDRMEARYFDLLRMSVINKTAEEIELYESAGEGIGNRLKKNIRYANNLDELILKVKSKRYTYTRISRLMQQIVLDIPAEIYALGNIEDICYIKPLAMNEMGAEYLKGLKKIQDVSKALKYEENPWIKKSLEIDVRAADIYNIISGEDLYQESDFVKNPAVLRLNRF